MNKNLLITTSLGQLCQKIISKIDGQKIWEINFQKYNCMRKMDFREYLILMRFIFRNISIICLRRGEGTLQVWYT
jgi:hypothetical protein